MRRGQCHDGVVMVELCTLTHTHTYSHTHTQTTYRQKLQTVVDHISMHSQRLFTGIRSHRRCTFSQMPDLIPRNIFTLTLINPYSQVLHILAYCIPTNRMYWDAIVNEALRILVGAGAARWSILTTTIEFHHIGL